MRTILPSKAFFMPKVILISIDGLRPDAISLAGCPNINGLMNSGASTLTARTVIPSVTLPCHTSMFRGVSVERHGITTNTFQPLARPVPSIIDAAHDAGHSCGMFFNWGPLRDLADPESLRVSCFECDAHRPEGDLRVAEYAERLIPELNLDFSFVYFGWTDECGHMHGWMSEAYLQAVRDADRCVGRVLASVREAGSDPVLLLLSDHGGHGKSHGTECAEDMTIPWILNGPGIVKRKIESQVEIIDTCTTIADLLAIPKHRYWEGRSLYAECFG